MGKLSVYEKTDFKQNREQAQDEGITVISYRNEGITIAAKYTGKMKNHFNVSLTYCSPNEKFYRKRGFNSVMAKMQNGQYTTMPAQYSDIENEIDAFISTNFGISYYNNLDGDIKIMC